MPKNTERRRAPQRARRRQHLVSQVRDGELVVERPVQRMQRIQRFAHGRISRPLTGRPAIPRAVRALLIVAQPVVRRAAARLIGRGFLPEHADLAIIDRP